MLGESKCRAGEEQTAGIGKLHAVHFDARPEQLAVEVVQAAGRCADGGAGLLVELYQRINMGGGKCIVGIQISNRIEAFAYRQRRAHGTWGVAVVGMGSIQLHEAA